ncbi:type 4 pilus major pilin [Pandoraea communis]|uniref:type 4 pilus major pilin n=1 Tax=Pandoraea communis TaxID=2508297 RepID=UPI0025A54707|nr:type 4 pilus major pilin [Pandoraea communis]MDM8356531.1 type 4 pilus major pilin [Pandoraea communis]
MIDIEQRGIGQQRQARLNHEVKSQRGVLSLEMIGVIAVVAIILVGVLVRLAQMYASSSTTNESSAVTSLFTSIRASKAGTGYGANGTNLIPTLAAMNALPGNLSYTGGVLLNSFGVAYTIVSSNNGYGFTLTSPGIPTADCIKLAVQQSQSGNWTGGITVGATAFAAGAISSAQATTACSAATNSIAFASNT